MSGPQHEDIVFTNYARGRQTFIIPLTFKNLDDAEEVIERISYGGDVWELRVDLLSPSPGDDADNNIPPLFYVERQIKKLQTMSQLPILFTIRTSSQGGKFKDDRCEEALALFMLAIDCGVQYIDVEIEWPQHLIQRVTASKGSTRVVASYHSWTGKVSWTSQELMSKFEAANAFGDIIKLSITSAKLEDSMEAALFVRNHRRIHDKPLLAVGMGAQGQLSRVICPISLVTHPLIPFPSAPGQLSLAQVHQARHLIGLLPRKRISVTGQISVAGRVAQALRCAFAELGYPYDCSVEIIASDAHVTSSIDVSNITSAESLLAVAENAFTDLTGRRAPSSVIKQSLLSQGVE